MESNQGLVPFNVLPLADDFAFKYLMHGKRIEEGPLCLDERGYLANEMELFFGVVMQFSYNFIKVRI